MQYPDLEARCQAYPSENGVQKVNIWNNGMLEKWNIG
jgi:hypothetical protein